MTNGLCGNPLAAIIGNYWTINNFFYILKTILLVIIFMVLAWRHNCSTTSTLARVAHRI